VIIMRMIERILGVVVGAGLVYLGYRLFLDVKGRRGATSGSGDFTIAGGNKLKLSKVGPGVFFALVGAGLIVFSLTRSVTYTSTTNSDPSKQPSAPSSVATVKFIGATGLPSDDPERAQRRAEIGRDIATLNNSVERATGPDRTTLQRATDHAKLALMEQVWADEWGELADFRDWLGTGSAPPDKSKQAVEFFQQR
jgi:hypothetical protein